MGAILIQPQGAVGNVLGPGASTDNAITRWDGTDGKRLQNSGVILDDSDNISEVARIDGGALLSDTLEIAAHSATLTNPSSDGKILLKNYVEWSGVNDYSATAGAVFPLMQWAETADFSGQSVVIPQGFWYRPILQYDTAQAFGGSATFQDSSIWEETAALGAHTVFTIGSYLGGPKYLVGHAGAGTPPTEIYGYSSSPKADAGSGSLTVPLMAGYQTNPVFPLIVFLGLQQLRGGTVCTEYAHYRANSGDANTLVLEGGSTITTEIGIDLRNISQGATAISLRSDAAGAYMDHMGDIRVGWGTTSAVYWRDLAVNIASLDDGHLDLTADVSVDVNSPLLDVSTALTVTGGTLNVGVDDTTAGTINVYGDNATAGGIIFLFQGDTHDGTYDSFRINVSSDFFNVVSYPTADIALNLGVDGAYIYGTYDGKWLCEVSNYSSNTASALEQLLTCGGDEDVWTHYQASGTNWSVGIDNSDSDKLKIHNATTLADTSLFEFATDGSMLVSTGPIYIRDTGIYIGSDADGYLDFIADLGFRFYGAPITVNGSLVARGPGEIVANGQHQIMASDNAAQAAGTGGGIAFQGKYTDAGAYITGAAVYMLKENGTSGEYGFHLCLASRDHGLQAAEVMRLTADGKVGIGTTTVPHGGVGAAKVVIEGVNGSTDGPHVQFTTATDNYPLLQILPWAHDTVAISWDAYYDGASWRSSDGDSCFTIFKNANALSFRADAPVAAGNAVTWVQAFVITSGAEVMFSPAAGLKTYWRDTAIYIASLADSFLDIVADGAVRISNLLQLGAAGSATGQLNIQGNGTTDPYIQFYNGTTYYSLGLDENDQDSFKITKAATIGSTAPYFRIGPIGMDWYVDLAFNSPFTFANASASGGVRMVLQAAGSADCYTRYTSTSGTAQSWSTGIDIGTSKQYSISAGGSPGSDDRFVLTVAGNAYFPTGKVAYKLAGGTTLPKASLGMGSVFYDGTDSSVDGPHIQYTTTADNYPLLGTYPYAHGDIAITFDSFRLSTTYYSSNSTSNYAIRKATNLTFDAEEGRTPNQSITWVTAFQIEPDGEIMHAPGTALKTYWRDSAIYIASLNDGYMDLDADSGFRFKTSSVEVESDEAFYWGAPATDGTWRIIRSGNDLLVERREAGAYVTKGTFTP